MFKKLLFTTSVAVGALLAVTTSAQNLHFINNNANSAQNSATIKVKWLGVAVENLSDALRSQLGGRIKDGSGVIIRNVQPNSPADRAGLQRHDILMSVDGKAISSADQLYQIVQQSKTDEAISVDIIRAGEFKSLKTNIGERNVAQTAPARPFNNPYGGFNHPFWNSQPNWNSPFFQQPFGQGWQGFNMPAFPNIPNNLPGKATTWSESESLSVKTLKDGKIHAELKAKDKDNNEKNYVFEGTRDSVINQIKQQKDMPQQHKDQLLGAVQGNSIQFYSSPGVNNFFNRPFPAMPGFPATDPWSYPQTPKAQQQHNRATF